MNRIAITRLEPNYILRLFSLFQEVSHSLSKNYTNSMVLEILLILVRSESVSMICVVLMFLDVLTSAYKITRFVSVHIFGILPFLIHSMFNFCIYPYIVFKYNISSQLILLFHRTQLSNSSACLQRVWYQAQIPENEEICKNNRNNIEIIYMISFHSRLLRITINTK